MRPFADTLSDPQFALVLSALTVAEVVSALTYPTMDEAQPWIWLLPSAGALAAAAICRRLVPCPVPPPRSPHDRATGDMTGKCRFALAVGAAIPGNIDSER